MELAISVCGACRRVILSSSELGCRPQTEIPTDVQGKRLHILEVHSAGFLVIELSRRMRVQLDQERARELRSVCAVGYGDSHVMRSNRCKTDGVQRRSCAADQGLATRRPRVALANFFMRPSHDL